MNHAWMHGPRGKLHVAPRAVCTVTSLHSMKDTQWDEELLRQFMLGFEYDFIHRIRDPAYWQQHPWEGLFDGIRHRLLFNMMRSARKKMIGYWEMTKIRVDLGQLAMQNPSVPCLIFGRPDHSLASSRLDAEQHDQSCSWWPAVCNPWVPCGWCLLCLWVLCADNAVTGSRPWEVHRTRIFVITDDFLNERVVNGMTVNQPAPVPTIPVHHDPLTTSSVQIEEVASNYTEGSACGSVCSDFVHVVVEPTSHWSETSSTASSSSYTILEPAPAPGDSEQLIILNSGTSSEAIPVEPATSMEPVGALAEATLVELASEDWEFID